MSKWWESSAHRGIIGLAPPDEWDVQEGVFDFPTHGYDGYLVDFDFEDARKVQPSREQWDELACEMIERWTKWRDRLAIRPDSDFAQ